MRSPGRSGRAAAADPVYSITGTRRSAAEEQRGRQQKYLWSMGIRTLCFLLAVVTTGPARWVFLTGAVLLPYVAVVFANAGRERAGAEPEAPGPVAAPALEPRRGDDLTVPSGSQEHDPVR